VDQARGVRSKWEQAMKRTATDTLAMVATLVVVASCGGSNGNGGERDAGALDAASSSSGGSPSGDSSGSSGSGSGGSSGDSSADSNGGGSGSGGVDGSSGDHDWPMYQHDAQRTGVSPNETVLSRATVSGLKKHWSVATGSTVESSASVVGNTAYIGSWDGNEYALDATTGGLVWKKNLGTAQVPLGCNPPYSSTMGVTASAAIAGGVLYTAGGDNSFHALDSSSGMALWSVSTIPSGDTQTDLTAFYTFGSPVVRGNYAYYGVSSGGNCPSIQGAVLQIDLSQHAVVSTFFTVPSGYLGAAVWGSPAVDAAGTTVYVGTGNCNGTLSDSSAACPSSGSYTDALVALDIGTPGKLAFKAAFLLPSQPASSDWDFGNTPTLFDDGHGRALVGAACKDGNFYALDASTMKLVWSLQLTTTNGGNPVAGDGSISPAAFASGSLYVAAGNGPGASFVYSIDPATGKPNWTAPISAGVIMGPVVYANGLLYVGTGSQTAGASPTVQVLDASSGSIVKSITGFGFSSSMPNFVSDSITVASGRLFFGTGTGVVYAFGL
jgi:outer membrane protein assembly factor BamB